MQGIEPRISCRSVCNTITMPTKWFCVVMNLQKNAVMPSFPFADVMQPYQLQVHNVFVMGGNVAVLRCTIPSFVRGLVQVTSWLKDEHLLGRTVVHPGGRYVLSVGGCYPGWIFHSFMTEGKTHTDTGHAISSILSYRSLFVMLLFLFPDKFRKRISANETNICKTLGVIFIPYR